MMKAASIERKIETEKIGGRNMKERIKKYFSENGKILAGGFTMMNGGNLYATYRTFGK